MVFWVFGYGSIVWNPGFAYDEKIVGYIKDYRRVFDLGKVLPHMMVFLCIPYSILSAFSTCRFSFLQHALTTEEHLKAPQELAHWRRKKDQFA